MIPPGLIGQSWLWSLNALPEKLTMHCHFTVSKRRKKVSLNTVYFGFGVKITFQKCLPVSTAYPLQSLSHSLVSEWLAGTEKILKDHSSTLTIRWKAKQKKILSAVFALLENASKVNLYGPSARKRHYLQYLKKCTNSLNSFCNGTWFLSKSYLGIILSPVCKNVGIMWGWDNGGPNLGWFLSA